MKRNILEKSVKKVYLSSKVFSKLIQVKDLLQLKLLIILSLILKDKVKVQWIASIEKKPIPQQPIEKNNLKFQLEMPWQKGLSMGKFTTKEEKISKLWLRYINLPTTAKLI